MLKFLQSVRFGSAVTVTAGNGVFAVALLLRNILLARLLPVEIFGIAASLMVLGALLEAAQESGMNRLIVQSNRGDDEGFQSTLHAMQLGLSLAALAFLGLIALPYAVIVGTPDLWITYLMVGALFCLTGFNHLDIYRFQRRGAFLPFALYQALPTLVGVALIYPLYLWLGDYRIIFGMVLGQQATRLAVTHLCAERPYRLSWDGPSRFDAWRFGWPLLLNSLLIFLAFNGDRLIVANRFGLEPLGWFSVAFLLSFVPSSVIASSVRALFLPRLSQKKETPAAFEETAIAVSQLGLLLGLGLVAGVALFGPAAIHFLFGEKYAPAAPMLILLAIMQATRLARVASSLVAVSKAETQNPLYANIVRCVFFPIAWIVAGAYGQVMMVIIIACVGEFVAFAVSLLLLNRRINLNVDALLWPIFLCLLAYASIAFTVVQGRTTQSLWLVPDIYAAAFFTFSICAALSMETLRKLIAPRRTKDALI